MNKLFLSTIITSIFSYGTLFSQDQSINEYLINNTNNRLNYSINTKISKIEECFYKAKEIKYKFDEKFPGIAEYWQNPKETDSLKTGDCEDQAIYLKRLLEKKNMFPEIVFGKYDSTENNFHVWLELQSHDTTYVLDPAMFGMVLYKSTSKIIGTAPENKHIIILNKENMDFLNYLVDRYNRRNRGYESLVFKNNKVLNK